METIQKFGQIWHSAAKRILLLLGILLIGLRAYPHCAYPLRTPECIVCTAEKEIGVRENGTNNDGVRIREYLRAVNVHKPAPFCAAFVAWVLNQCGIPHSINAWSPSATAKNRIYDRRKPNENRITPEGGDVGTLYYPSLKRIGHVLIITKWGDKWVETIEGNTTEAGTRETRSGNDGVFKRKRLKSTIYQVSRWR
jgi:hypothetical protein